MDSITLTSANFFLSSSAFFLSAMNLSKPGNLLQTLSKLEKISHSKFFMKYYTSAKKKKKKILIEFKTIL